MAGKGRKGNRDQSVIIVRREEVVEGGHHGGAWKVAYADFVTAMMAFFLLMWLLNATTEDQRKGLADYFSPNNLLSHASSGTGQPFGGHTVFDQGALVSDRGAAQVIVGKRPVVEDPPDDDADTPQVADRHGAAAEAGPEGDATTGKPVAGTATLPTSQPTAAPRAITLELATPEGATSEAPAPAQADRLAAVAARPETPPGGRAPTDAEFRAEQERREKQAFEVAAEQIRQAVKDDPALAAISRQLAIDITPEGLRIQLLDEERLAMFPTGSAEPNDRAKLLLAKVAPVLMRLSEDIAVVGHTDATPFAGSGKSNWELSTERANTTRRLLTDAGLQEPRVSRVTGLADRDPLLPADPLAAANRRIAIIVLRGTKKPAAPSAPPAAAAPAAAPASVPPTGAMAAPAVAPAHPVVQSPMLPPTPPAALPPALPSTPPPAPPSAQPPAQPPGSPSASRPTQSPTQPPPPLTWPSARPPPLPPQTSPP